MKDMQAIPTAARRFMHSSNRARTSRTVRGAQFVRDYSVTVLIDG
jgi:hypothetical protein